MLVTQIIAPEVNGGKASENRLLSREVAPCQPDNFNNDHDDRYIESMAGAPHRQEHIGNGTIGVAVFLSQGGKRAFPVVKQQNQPFNGYGDQGNQQCPIVPAGNGTKEDIAQARDHEEKNYGVDQFNGEDPFVIHPG